MKIHQVIKYVMVCDGHLFMLAINLCAWFPVFFKETACGIL